MENNVKPVVWYKNVCLLTRSAHRGATVLSKLRFTSTNLMRLVNREPANSRTVDDSFMSSKVLKQHAWKPPGRYARAGHKILTHLVSVNCIILLSSTYHLRESLQILIF